MVKRKQYEDTKFHFVTTTNPYAPASKDVQTFIRRQAMKDAGMERRKRNKKKKEDRLAQASSSSPENSWMDRSHRIMHEPGHALMKFENTSMGSLVTLPLNPHPGHASAAYPVPSPSYAIPDEYWKEEEHCYSSPREYFDFFTHPLNQIDPFASMPIVMDQDCRRLFNFALGNLENGKLPNIRGWWLKAGLEFPTMFRQKLAISAQLSALRSGTNGSADWNLSTKFTTMAVGDAVRKLNDPVESISNDNLSTIIALTYGRLDKKWVSGGWWIHLANAIDWEPHLRSAHEIIRKRGGIDTIDSPALRQEIYWIDYIAAAHQDTEPLYALPEIPTRALEKALRRARDEYPSESGYRTHSGLAHLRPILERLDDMNCIIAARRNKCSAYGMEPWQDGESTTDWLNPITHGLLRVRSERPMVRHLRHAQAFEAMRLATILYTFAVRALPDNKKRPITVQDQRLIELIRDKEISFWVIWDEMPCLGLWVLAILSLSSRDEAEEMWLCSCIRNFAKTMNIYSTHHLLVLLKEVAWEKEFSRMLLDSVWSIHEIVDVTEHDVPEVPFYEPYTTPPMSPSVPGRFYAMNGRV